MRLKDPVPVYGGVPVAGDDLCGRGLRSQPKRPQRLGLDRGREVRVGADGAGDLAHRDLLARS